MEKKSWRQKISWPKSDRRIVALLFLWLGLFLFTGCIILLRVLSPAGVTSAQGNGEKPFLFFAKNRLNGSLETFPGEASGMPLETPGRLTRAVLTQSAEYSMAHGTWVPAVTDENEPFSPNSTSSSPGFPALPTHPTFTGQPGQGTPGPGTTGGTVTATWFIRYFPTRTAVYLPTRTPTRTYTPRTNYTRTPTATVTLTTTQTQTLTVTVTPTVTATPTVTPTLTATLPPVVIAFSADNDGDGLVDLISIPPDGSSAPVVILQNAYENLLCDWSPDGSRLLFESLRGTPPSRQLYLVDRSGTNEQIIPGLPAGDNSQAAWSPDGSRLVFRNHNGSQADLYLIQLDGSGLKALTNDGFDDADPAWSPDGNTIYFISNRQDSRDEIYSLDITTEPYTPLRLTNTDENEAGPRPSPDGSKLVYSRQDGSQWEIYLGSSNDLSAPTNLTNSSSNEVTPSWSTNGDQIVFVSDQGAGGRVDLYLMNNSGGNINRITNTAAVEYRPRWKP